MSEGLASVFTEASAIRHARHAYPDSTSIKADPITLPNGLKFWEVRVRRDPDDIAEDEANAVDQAEICFTLQRA
jgi:hypothetical protein